MKRRARWTAPSSMDPAFVRREQSVDRRRAEVQRVLLRYPDVAASLSNAELIELFESNNPGALLLRIARDRAAMRGTDGG